MHMTSCSTVHMTPCSTMHMTPHSTMHMTPCSTMHMTHHSIMHMTPHSTMHMTPYSTIHMKPQAYMIQSLGYPFKGVCRKCTEPLVYGSAGIYQPPFVSWFVPQSSMSLRSQASASDNLTHFRCFQNDLRPNWVIGLLLILSHGLSYVSIILLYLILSNLLVYILIPDLDP